MDNINDARAHPEREIVKRDGRRQPYDRQKIYHAVNKCLHEGLEQSPAVSGQVAEQIAFQVENHLVEANSWPVHIEAIQDLVEDYLMQDGHHAAAKAYIRYRAQREQERLKSGSAVDGDLLAMITGIVRRSARGLNCVSADEVIRTAAASLFPGATATDMWKAVGLSARTMIEVDPEYSQLASRILLEQMYEEAFGRVVSRDDAQAAYVHGFADYVRYGVEQGKLDPRMLEFDLEFLAQQLDASLDLKFKYFGAFTVYDRYLLKDDAGRRFELPQYFWMRVAMGVALSEKTSEARHQWAVRFYQKLAQHLYCPSTPTLFNAGTVTPQLASCFLTHVRDELGHILQSSTKNGLLSKFSGGLGTAWQAVRGINAVIKSTGGKTGGIMPWLKIDDSTCGAVDQGGKRKGAWCAYLETWHRDIEEFLDARKNTGDERRRLRDLHTALWVNDLFMQRVQEDGLWTLFSPDECPDLPELYGAAFKQRYEEYEQQAQEGTIRNFRLLRARDLRRKIVQALFETGHPWICFKDVCNVRSPQDHVGVVHSSNLCTEITLNTGIPKQVPFLAAHNLELSKRLPEGYSTMLGYRAGKPEDEEVAVCNIGSLVVPNHIADGTLDEELLADTVWVAIRLLDNVIDGNLYQIPEAKRSNQLHRPIGLGFMGLQDALLKLDIRYASDEGIQFSDRLQEAISYYAIEASAVLARERGSYASFNGSKWSRGILPIDTVSLMEEERGERIVMDKGRTKDWESLRTLVMGGMRNSNTMALAPTATIGNIIGVSAVSEPYGYMLYVRSTMSGEFTVVNEFLVEDLKALGLWDAEMLSDLKFYDGSVQEIERIPEWLREKYKTCFEIEPYWIIAAASRRQKWLDQSQSTNLWYRGNSMKAIWEMYEMAWKMGLKTTYYLRTEAKTSIEKSTIDVNRYGVQPRWMQNKSASAEVEIERSEGGVRPERNWIDPVDQGDEEPTGEIKACRLDNPDCEACQ